ncbi:hypothetical protein P7C70_g1555, partial [Phenoliferia sp. Uapishka_3]
MLIRLSRASVPIFRLAGTRRHLHLQQAVAFKVLESHGIPVSPFQLVSSKSETPRSASFPVLVQAQLTDAAGVCALADGSFGDLKGIRFQAANDSDAQSIVSTVLSTPFHLPNAPTGLQHRQCTSAILSPIVDPKRTVRVLFYCDRSATSGGPALLAGDQYIYIKGFSTACANELDSFDSLRVFASQHPSRTVQLPIKCADGLTSAEAQRCLEDIARWLRPTSLKPAGDVLCSVYKDVFVGRESLRVEVWVTENADGTVSVSDARIELDDFAAPRHDRAGLSVGSQIHPSELKAAELGLFLIKPPVTPSQPRGNVGCFGYGAGLAMATMDAVVTNGGAPANFLDGGGGANAVNAKASTQILASDPDVKVIFVNIFGGITQCDKVAQGIIEAVQQTPRLNSGSVPMVIRMRGTGEAAAKKLVSDISKLITRPIQIVDEFPTSFANQSQRHIPFLNWLTADTCYWRRIPFVIEDDFSEAARLAVEAAR